MTETEKRRAAVLPVVVQVAGVLAAGAGLLMLAGPAWMLLVAGVAAVVLGTLAEMGRR